MTKKTIWILVVAVLLAGAWWLIKRPEAEGGTIKIGGAFGQSGICAEFGEGELQAATLAVEEVNKAGGINGKYLKLVSEDTQCDNKTTVTAISKLVNVDKVVAIIGPTWGDSFQGGYPILREKRVVAVTPSTAMESLEFAGQPVNFVFSTWFLQSREVEAQQRYAAKMGWKRMTIVHDQDPFGAMMAKLFREQAPGNGIEIIDEHEVPVGTKDFKTIVSKIKTKTPDAVFASFVTPEFKAIFIKQAKELGVKTQFFATADLQNLALLSSFGATLEGVIYTYPKGTAQFDAFAEKYKKRFGVEPGPSTSNAYDAANALVAAMKEAGTNGAELERALGSIELAGVTYDILKFSDAHQIAGGEFEIKAVKNGKFVKVE